MIQRKCTHRLLRILLLSAVFSSGSFPWSGPGTALGQETRILGFVDVSTTYQTDQLSFGLGEQDLFITSELTDRLSFLGETVFKAMNSASTPFMVGIERIVLDYNIFGNHHLVVGKHHTPVNYWNDTYHHGRVFFPTIQRPLMFSDGLLPIHTTGVGLNSANLGQAGLGYDFMIGNGMGSGDLMDDNRFKSVTLAVHARPWQRLRIGASLYLDEFRHAVSKQTISQTLASFSASWFGKWFEVLAEGSIVTNKADSLGEKTTSALYLYAGIPVLDRMLIPYIRIDMIGYQQGEFLYTGIDKQSLVMGIRHEIGSGAVLKLEYQHLKLEPGGSRNTAGAQLAVGF